MTFTDDDLKRLEAFINLHDKARTVIGQDFIVESKLKSLLARLEAAENVIRSEKRWDCCVHTDGNKCQMAVAWKAWCKACGK